MSVADIYLMRTRIKLGKLFGIFDNIAFWTASQRRVFTSSARHPHAPKVIRCHRREIQYEVCLYCTWKLGNLSRSWAFYFSSLGIHWSLHTYFGCSRCSLARSGFKRKEQRALGAVNPLRRYTYAQYPPSHRMVKAPQPFQKSDFAPPYTRWA